MRKGYLNRPEATTEVFDSDGWLRLGGSVLSFLSGHDLLFPRVQLVISVNATLSIERILQVTLDIMMRPDTCSSSTD